MGKLTGGGSKSFHEQAIEAAQRFEDKRMAELEKDVSEQKRIHRKEVGEVIAYFNRITGLILENHIEKILDVVVIPKAKGFHFKCFNPAYFMEKMKELTRPEPPVIGDEYYYRKPRTQAVFKEDDRKTRVGRFSAANTHGSGFREIGPGNSPSMHVAVSLTDGVCDVHIDSHGYTLGSDTNIGLFIYGLYHLKYDLLPEVPFFKDFYGPLGDDGMITWQPRIGWDMDERLRKRDRLIFFFYNVEGYW